MTITVTDLGGAGSVTTPSSLSMTTTNAITAGQVVVVFHYANATTGTANSITDTSSNNYLKGISNNLNAPLCEIYIVTNATAMASGNSITIPSFGVNALRQAMSAWAISGLVSTPSAVMNGVLDTRNGVSKGTATGSTATPCPAIAAANMLLVAATVMGSTPGTFTPGTGWTQLGGFTTSPWIFPQYQIVTTVGGGTTVNPTWVNSVIFQTMSFGLVAAPPANLTGRAPTQLMGFFG